MLHRTRRSGKTKASVANAALVTDHPTVASPERGNQEFGDVERVGTDLPQFTQNSGRDFGTLPVHQVETEYCVSRPTDADELEADHVAEQVVHANRPTAFANMSRHSTPEQKQSGVRSSEQ